MGTVLAFFTTLIVGCGSSNNNKEKIDIGSEQGQIKTGSGGLSSPENKTPIASDTIAYVSSSLKRKSIRLIQSYGSDDRELWTVPVKTANPTSGHIFFFYYCLSTVSFFIL